MVKVLITSIMLSDLCSSRNDFPNLQVHDSVADKELSLPRRHGLLPVGGRLRHVLLIPQVLHVVQEDLVVIA